MGGSSSTSSEQKTDQSTKITETTTTNVGDIGFTGKSAVDLVQILSNGAIAQTTALRDIVAPFVELQANIAGGAGAGANRVTTPAEPEKKDEINWVPIALAAGGTILALRAFAK